MNVKRYWISPNGIACEDNEGTFVRYEDYAALEARCAALASLEAEALPEWTNEQCLEFLSIAFRHAEIKGDLQLDDIRLGVKMVNAYRAAPPAPASVPDDVSGPLAHAYKELTPTFMRNHIDVFELYGIYPDGSAGIQAMRIALDGMNRRAAMLQGADGNSPVVPDGWVACSERMPEDTQMVLTFSHGEIVAAYWNYVMCPIEYKKYRAFTYLSGSRLDGVTHWMPLPPPPAK